MIYSSKYMPLFKLCNLAELDDIDSRGFVISDVSPESNIFIVKNKLYAISLISQLTIILIYLVTFAKRTHGIVIYT